MNHQCSGWSIVADSTPARIVGKSASRVPSEHIMRKYIRIMSIKKASILDQIAVACTGNGAPVKLLAYQGKPYCPEQLALVVLHLVQRVAGLASRNMRERFRV